MLPHIHKKLACENYVMFFFLPQMCQGFQHENIDISKCGSIVLRVDVVLDDPGRDQRLHLGQWSILLPSDVSHCPVWNCDDVMSITALWCGFC